MKKLSGRNSAWIAVWTIAATVVSASSASAAIHSNVPQDVEKYALSEGLAFAKKMLSLEPAGMVDLNVQEIGQVTLGPGLQQHVIDWGKASKTDASSMLSVVKPIQEWEFILEKDGKPITAMIIGKAEGKLQVSRIGGPADKYHQAWSKFDMETNATEPPAADIVKALKEQEKAAAAPNTSGVAGGNGAASTQRPDETNNLPLLLTCAAGLLGIFGVGAYKVRKKTNKQS